MIAYYFFAFLIVLPYLSWLALLFAPLGLVLSPFIIGSGMFLSLLSIVFGSAGASILGIVGVDIVLVMFALFGEIFLIPLAIFWPLSLALSVASYFASLYT